MKETVEETRKQGLAKNLKKVSATQIRLAEKPVGFKLKGKFISLVEREREEVVEGGEIKLKKLYTMVIEDEAGNRTKFLADAGLRTAFEDAAVVQGDYFEAVKGEKVTLSKGRTMNSWDIFQYAE